MLLSGKSSLYLVNAYAGVVRSALE